MTQIFPTRENIYNNL